MKLIEIIQKIGPENCSHQFLDKCITQCQKKKDGTSLVTFGTDAISPNDLVQEWKFIGIILWLPRDKVKEVMQTR